MTSNSFIITGIALVCLFLVITLVSADTQTEQYSSKIQLWTPSEDSLEPRTTSIMDSRVIIVNFTQHLEDLNGEMNWNLSPKQINEYSVRMKNGILKKYVYNPQYPEALDIPNQRQFYLEISDTLGLTQEEHAKIIQKIRENYQENFEKNERLVQENFVTQNLENSKFTEVEVTSIPADSQSAPSAVGKVGYFCIFVDFQYPREVPPGYYYAWTPDAITAVMYSVYYATHDDIAGVGIAPEAANMDSEWGYTGPDSGIYVNGSNTGNTQETYGREGWMERVIMNMGYSDGDYDGSTDGWVSDDLVRELKDHTFTDVDHVVLIFLSHDNKGGFAVSHQNGEYADRAQVPFWIPGETNPNNYTFCQSGVYQHEILHTFGAMDEYLGSSGCNLKSIHSVSPMSEMYVNTNHAGCPTPDLHTVMNYPYDYVTISDSTRKFIGWGDFDLDGELDPLDPHAYWGSKIGVFRNSTHMFYLDYSGNGLWDGAGIDRLYNFGLTDDIPVSGDWNGNSITEIGVFRPSTHSFYLDKSGNGLWGSGDTSSSFGLNGDLPVAGDWNGNGITEIGVFRPSTHMFYLDYNGNGAWNGAGTDRLYNFGIAGDIPVSGDWNGNGITEIGVFRPSTHSFYLDKSGDGLWGVGDTSYSFGLNGDVPVAGDWNGNGIPEIGVFRPSTQMFYLDYNANGAWNGAGTDRLYTYGLTGDQPTAGLWI